MCRTGSTVKAREGRGIKRRKQEAMSESISSGVPPRAAPGFGAEAEQTKPVGTAAGLSPRDGSSDAPGRPAAAVPGPGGEGAAAVAPSAGRDPDGLTTRTGAGLPDVLIVTEDEGLLDDLLRLCAAAGTEPEVSFGAPIRSGTWEAVPLALVGDDCAEHLARLPRRSGVLLVGRDMDDQGVWRRAVGVGAEHVVLLPDGEPWLADRIADAVEGVGEPAVTIGVVGGRGGAGASTLACALAVASARSGRRTVLVDADPLGGGLDVLLGAERVSGLRWPDLAEAQGRVSSGALEESLPKLDDLSVLSWDRGDSAVIVPEAIRSVLAAARRRSGVVVVDLPRRMDDGVVEALSQTDVGLLVVPAELRAIAAAQRVASRVSMVLPDLRLVARGPFPAGLSGEEIAHLLDLPFAGELPDDKALPASLLRGAVPGGDGRSPLARFCTAFLAEALSNGGSAVA